MRRTLLALALSGLAASASADLLNAWDAALLHDPDYAAARADAEAGREELPQARAQLLPQASAQYSRGRAESAITNAVSNRDTRYGTESWNVQIRQPLFRARAIAGYWQADALVMAAEQRLQAARQNLGIRLIDAWADYLMQATLRETARIDIEASKTLVRLTERQLKAGEVTRLERTQAMQRLAEARQALAEADRRARTSETIWRQITGGHDLPPARAPDDLASRLLADAGTLTDLETRCSSHPSLKAAEADVTAAREEVRKANSDRLPTVDLVASRSFNNQDTDTTIGSKFDTSRLLLQASMPLFTSGSLSSAIREAEARHRKSQASLESTRNKVIATAEASWLDLSAAMARWSAGDAARERAQTALRSAELGVPAGQATLADLARAQTDLALALRTRSEATSDALKLWGRWQDAIGQLDEGALKRLNQLAGW